MALACRPTCSTGASTRRGDRRTHAVGADDEPGVDAERAAVGAGAGHAVRAAVAAAGEPGDGDAEANVGARFAGGGGEDRIDHGSPRRVEGVDAVRRLDGDRHDGVLVGKRHAVNGRGAGGAHAVEQSPAVELQDSGAHQRVGRRRVGAEPRAVDEGDAYAAAGEEHGGGCARDTGADDDHVEGCIQIVGWMLVHVDSVLSRSQAAIWRRERCRASRCRVTTTASAPTPSRKLERRVRWKRWPSTYRPGQRCDAVVVDELAVGDNAREMQPRIAAPVAGRPDDRRHSGVSEVEPSAGHRSPEWAGGVRGEDFVGERVGGDVAVDPVQETAQAPVGLGGVGVEIVGEGHARPVDGREPAGEGDAVGGERREVDFAAGGPSNELQR